MPAYAVGLLRNVTMGPAIAEYLARIDATLEPYGGAFLVHDGRRQMLEGSLTDDFVVIAFPNWENAIGWCESDAYQSIIGLRRGNAAGAVFVVDGVPPGHRAVDILGATP